MKKAQSLVEYALILILISIVAITALNLMGKRMSLKYGWNNINYETNIKNTMTEYCKQKGLVYNAETLRCEKIAIK